MTLAEVLAQDSRRLQQDLDLDPREARLEIQILLCEALGVARSWLIGHDREALAEPAAQSYSALLTRRLAGEPIAYIIGRREFFGLEFKTTPAVLIPRPETELLVELALARIPEDQPCKVLDLGTGSGAIAISIARSRPLAAVTAVDQSPQALGVARDNAARLQVPNLCLLHSDWFGALGAQTFDLIVSNPPYVEAGDPHLQRGDVRFEPLSALASGADGLDDIRRIAAAAPQHLNPGSWLLLEHGYNQGEGCRDILRQQGFSEVETIRDLAGLERVSVGLRAA
ncbi:release factor glutamine methyltransferase [Sulfurimicrobium lacus]|uniref:Release factor glutamine methyltransferase n=1 Tax=Sulfurimicrobium lacus TaxID=2715678 RepID=A0A6F8VEA7_9PROT|nr:peptide chain release factor N(5)-glutamine methyltransferase [Sulfurimicrobium lacus]BCB28014.1 release factor glutamine methyltransferase [Sulfurimicrobium lacus]